jgi:hypothetical protein
VSGVESNWDFCFGQERQSSENPEKVRLSWALLGWRAIPLDVYSFKATVNQFYKIFLFAFFTILNSTSRPTISTILRCKDRGIQQRITGVRCVGVKKAEAWIFWVQGGRSLRLLGKRGPRFEFPNQEERSGKTEEVATRRRQTKDLREPTALVPPQPRYAKGPRIDSRVQKVRELHDGILTGDNAWSRSKERQHSLQTVVSLFSVHYVPRTHQFESLLG